MCATHAGAIRAGDAAPDFTLPSTAGGAITLSAFRGRSNVLLAFFPLAFTRTCTNELCAFTDDLAQFEHHGTKVLGISVDSIPTLKEYRAKYGMTVDLLSDFKREVCRRYGTLIDDLFFSKRAYFIIDRKGIVRWTHTERELGHKRDNQELLTQLERLS